MSKVTNTFHWPSLLIETPELNSTTQFASDSEKTGLSCWGLISAIIQDEMLIYNIVFPLWFFWEVLCYHNLVL